MSRTSRVKVHRIRGVTTLAKRGTNLIFGDIGLKSLEPGRITDKQIESIRQAVNRRIKDAKGSELLVRVFARYPVTKKPSEVRMGGGPGPVEYWVDNVRDGTVMLEISYASQLDEIICRDALRLAQVRLPVMTKIVTKRGRGEL